MAKLQDIIL